ncbi:MAG: hypothetical protein CGW95_11430 [Phenylobacterium zucineum]|nr:MAG: hypothetical protein CGW95_11430 [Phenylobacterium zucineum]
MSEMSDANLETLQASFRHRVVNTFHFLAALARLRAQRGDDPAPGQGLLWMADTITDLGTLERFVRGDEVDIQAYLLAMVSVWRDRYRSQRLDVIADTCPLILHEAMASTLVLAVLQLVANAAGHIRAGNERSVIRLGLVSGDGGYRLGIAGGTDLGMTAPEDTFGLWLAKRLAQQIKGELVLAADGAATLTFRV